MLARTLGNRFKKIESKINIHDPRKIVIKHIGDLFGLYNNIAEDISFLDNKQVYYDLGFFKGDRKRCKEANESRDIFYIWGGKEKYYEDDADREDDYDDDDYNNNTVPSPPQNECSTQEKAETTHSETHDNPETQEEHHDEKQKIIEEHFDEEPDEDSGPESNLPGIRQKIPPCGSYG
jgi:hypothetical protein